MIPKPPATVDEVVFAIAKGNIRLRTIADALNRAERSVDPVLQKARRAKLVRYTSKGGWKLVVPTEPNGDGSLEKP